MSLAQTTTPSVVVICPGLICDGPGQAPMKNVLGQCVCATPGQFDFGWLILAAVPIALLFLFRRR